MLEYHSPILWSPVAVTLINQLESVQRRFTKRLPGFQTLPYDERCALLGLDRLELRRLRTDLYNFLLQDYTRFGFAVSRQFFSRLVAIQEHLVIHLNCFYRIRGLIVDIISFAVRVLRIWNSLPE